MGRFSGKVLLGLVVVLLILIPFTSPASTQYRSDPGRSGYVNESFSGGLTFEKVWTYNTNKPGFNACQPVVHNGYVYIVSYDGRVYKISLGTGQYLYRNVKTEH